jgi:uncharacterized protein YehS (DUF1456 family)
MKINDILFNIKKALSLSSSELIEAYALAEYIMNKERLENILKRRQDEGYQEATYEELGIFLDGLVLFKRGVNEKETTTDEVVDLTNNLIMKKLRVALELKEPELLIVFGLAEIHMSKRQIGSLFRKEGTKNFRPASDELLMAFIEGLDEFYYDGEEI